jgi:hypothetical protein
MVLSSRVVEKPAVPELISQQPVFRCAQDDNLPKPPPNSNECNTLPLKCLNGILYSHKSDNIQRINNIHHPNRMNTLPATPLNGILYKNRGEGGTPPPYVHPSARRRSGLAKLTPQARPIHLRNRRLHAKHLAERRKLLPGHMSGAKAIGTNDRIIATRLAIQRPDQIVLGL